MSGTQPESSTSRAKDAANDPTSELTLLEAARIILDNRRLVIGLPLALSVIVIIVSLLLPRTHSSSAAFAPQSAPSSLGGLASLANQFGVTLPGTGESESPDFYADLLVSDQILRAVVETEYSVGDDGVTITGTLVTFFDIEESTPPRSREKAVEQLRNSMSVAVGPKTGVVEFTVRAPYATLAQAIAQRALESMNEFNLRSRQSQATAQRVFIGGRVEEAAQELRLAEDRLQAFLQRNRDYSGSPQLAFEHDRLQRQMDLRHQIYTTLVQAFEQARIDEVRNLPVLTVVEPPVVPVKPDSRLIALKVLLTLIVGTLIALALAFLREFTRPRGAQTMDEAARFEQLSRETMAELRRPWRFFAGS